MTTTVVALFDDRGRAEGAIQNLVAAGFTTNEISAVANNPEGDARTYSLDEVGNLGTEGALSGASSGALLGGAIGFLVGLGTLAIPAIGLIAAGPIVGLLTGAGIGAVSGSVVGALIGLGIPQNEAETYEALVRGGGTLVTVHVDESRASQAFDVLDQSSGHSEMEPDYSAKSRLQVRQYSAAHPTGSAMGLAAVETGESFEDCEPDFRAEFESYPAREGSTYATYEPASLWVPARNPA